MPRDGEVLAPAICKAFLRIESKAVTESANAYIVKGVATTPRMDRVDDIVEPLGAQINQQRLPKLFLYHDSTLPVGSLVELNPTAKDIPFVAHIPKVVEEGVIRDRVLEAVHSIQYDLLSYVSIGFRPIKYEPIKDAGYRYTEWEFVELSLVGVPANPDAVITGIKSVDDRIRTEIKSLNAKRTRAPSGTPVLRDGVVRLFPSPAVAGPSAAQSIGVHHVNLNELLSGLEAKRAANDAAQRAIGEAVAKEGRTMNQTEREEFDALDAEIEQIDQDVARFRKQMQRVTTATPVQTQDTTPPIIRGGGVAVPVQQPQPQNGNGLSTVLARSMVPKELVYVRHVKAAMLSQLDGRPPLEVAKELYPDMQQLHQVFERGRSVEKSNVTALNVADTTGGSPLAQYQLYTGDFVEWLRPQTIIGKFGTNGIPGLRRVPFMVSIASQTSGGAGYWVGEGKPKPLTSFGFARTTLGMTKVANIAVVTQEQLRASTPSADMLLRDALSGALIERIDRDFIDPDSTGTANVKPASITSSGTGTAASGTINSAVITDLQTLYSPVLGNNADVGSLVLIMSARTALALSLAVDSLGRNVFPDISMNGGRLKGIPVIVSQYADFGGGNSPASNGLVVLVAASEIWLADDGAVSVDMSTEASLQMLDNPTNDVMTPTATTMVSMFQTNSVALRAERFINWYPRRSGVVSYLTNVAYSGLAS